MSSHSVAEVDVCGVPITDENPFDLVERVLDDYESDIRRITVLAMHITTLNAIEEPGLRAALHAADYLHADGVSVLLIAKAAGARELKAVPTTDLGPRFLEGFERRFGRPARVAIIGGEPGVAQGAMKALIDEHDIDPVFVEDGYQSNWVPVLDDVNRAMPDIVFVGLGMPLEAFWVHQYHQQLPPTALVITCGGWLRLLSGEETRAPKFLLRLHLEFAWRWVTDFKRTNSRYSRGIATVAKGILQARKNRKITS